MKLEFYKSEGKWYVDLPDWEGSLEDLEMVYGADDLLEVLAHQLNTERITFEIWTSKPDMPTGMMTKIDQTLDGATYQVSNCTYYDGTAWLCNVTKFVFGGIHPNHIYFRVAHEGNMLTTNDTVNGKTSDDAKKGVASNNIEYKKIKVTAVNLDQKKSVTITADMKKISKCQTQDAVKKALEKQILDSKVFRKEDLPKLKYQGRKDVLDEWKAIRPKVAKEEQKMEERLNDMGNRTTPQNITSLGTNEVFVFGSNSMGMHAGGAARYAMEHFGAVWGEGHGLQGKSYAIDSMSGLDVMAGEVKTFTDFAKSHKSKTFLVTAIGCGIAGYSVSEIAPLFECCKDIPNVSLPASFWDVIGATEIDIEDDDDTQKFDLGRFLSAQEFAYPIALEEMQNGRKRSHWIWYIFPQQKGLGHSYNSQYYGLDGIEEAKAYLAHPVLGARLREISEALLEHKGKDIYSIMGSDIDALKLETSMKLFDMVSPNNVFDKVLRAFF